MEDNKFRQRGLGKLLYRMLNSIFYFQPILMSNIRFRRILLLPLYSGKQKNGDRQGEKKDNDHKTVVYMVLPETTFSGGLSDRLRGIVAIYAECKRQGLPFRIVFEPLHLEDYLVPNEYDWSIQEDDLCWDVNKVYPCTLLTYHASARNRYQHFVQNTILRHFIAKDYRQIHVYSNMICCDEEYGRLFKELFHPSPELQQLLDEHLEKIGGTGSYISCTFRFRQLLGDFKEGGDTLPVAQRQAYIDRCVRTVEQLHQSCQSTILVTSDSGTFLAQVSRLPYVYVIPGKVVHIGFTFDASKQVYMKSFVDYYMLSYARTVYLVRDKLMYHSGFPRRAALLNGAEYREIGLEAADRR